MKVLFARVAALWASSNSPLVTFALFSPEYFIAAAWASEAGVITEKGAISVSRDKPS